MRDNNGWEWFVGICVIFLTIIAICKFLFWACVGIGILAIIWIILAIITKNYDYFYIPIIAIIICFILGYGFYEIGYGIEKTESGKNLVDAAKTVVEIDNNINNIPNQIIDETTNTLNAINVSP